MIIVNVIQQGGIKQFSNYLENNFKLNDKISYVQYKGFNDLFIRLKKDKNITFTCNSKEVYLFVFLSYFFNFNINILLHDYKIRKGSSFKEKLLIKLFCIFEHRFSNVIVHSKLSSYGTYLKMPYHQEESKKYRFNLLQFGRIEEYKNIDYLVDLISRIQDISLIIAGKGDISKVTSKLIENSSNISLVNQYIDSNLLQRLLDSSDGISLVYNDITQTGLIDYALKNEKIVLLSNIDEFKLVLGSEVVIHIDINNIDMAVNQLNNYLNKFNAIKDNKSNVFLNYEPDSNKEWELYVNKIISFME